MLDSSYVKLNQLLNLGAALTRGNVVDLSTYTTRSQLRWNFLVHCKFHSSYSDRFNKSHKINFCNAILYMISFKHPDTSIILSELIQSFTIDSFTKMLLQIPISTENYTIETYCILCKTKDMTSTKDITNSSQYLLYFLTDLNENAS